MIDHGVCFSPESKLRTVIWDLAGEPIPTDLRRDVRRLALDARSGPVRDELSALLAEDEVEALVERAGETAALDRLPQPDTDRRPFPWPPI